MFSIVSMQDVLVNLKGSENLFQMFDRPSRTRKKSTSTKTSINSQDFPIKNVWVLPSHIIIKTSFSSKEEVLAYDQVPRLGPNKHDVFKLLTNESVGVFDVFRIVADSTKEYLFILLKNGQIITWVFSRPEYEWQRVDNEFSLFKSKESQLVSFTQDNGILLWCERRSATQFCICKIDLLFRNDKVVFEGSKAILHNCLPMTINVLPEGNFTFLPVSNKTLGLFLFWSTKSEQITVRMWGCEFNHHQHVATTTDYQTIVRDCIYLWINHSANLDSTNNSKSSFFHQANHPTSKELIILQNDLNVHTIHVTKDGSVTSKLLCTLEHQGVGIEGKENFAKQIIRFHPLQRMLLLTMFDGTINIYENQGGLFLWKTQTFRSCAPQIWIRKGMYPAAGVWNRSGIWNIRPKPIAEQLKELLLKQNMIFGEDNQDETMMKPSDPDFALNVFESENRRLAQPTSTIKSSSRKWRIKQGVSRSEEIPIKALFNILDMWQLRNASAETALSLAVKLKDSKENEGEGDDSTDDLTEIFYLIETINDPVLLLVLFGKNKVFPFKVKRRLTSKLKHLLRQPCAKKIDGDVMLLLQNYLSMEKVIQNMFNKKVGTVVGFKQNDLNKMEDNVTLPCSAANENASRDIESSKTVIQKSDPANEFDIRKEISILQQTLPSTPGNTTSLASLALEKHLLLLLDVGGAEMMDYILFVMIDKSRCGEMAVSDQFCFELWRNFLRENSTFATRVLIYLWQQEPSKVLDLLQSMQSFVDKNSNKLLPYTFKMEKFTKYLRNILYMPNTSAVVGEDPIYATKLSVFNKLLQMTRQHSSTNNHEDVVVHNDDVVDFVLEHGLVDEVFSYIRQQPSDSLQHKAAFFRLVTHLMEEKLLAQYADRLTSVTPSTFKMAEFWNLFKQHSIDAERSQLFVRNDDGMSVGAMKNFIEKLL